MHHVLCTIADMLTNLVNRHLYKTKKLRNKQWWKPVIVAGNAKYFIQARIHGGAGGPSPPSPPNETGHQTSNQYVQPAMGFPDFSFCFESDMEWICSNVCPLDKILDRGLTSSSFSHVCSGFLRLF